MCKKCTGCRGWETAADGYVQPRCDHQGRLPRQFPSNHPFVDGNKRIAAALFLWFMEKNGILYRADGTRHIADNALVAITLMIAESDPQQKDILTKMVVNLIKDGK